MKEENNRLLFSITGIDDQGHVLEFTLFTYLDICLIS